MNAKARNAAETFILVVRFNFIANSIEAHSLILHIILSPLIQVILLFPPLELHQAPVSIFWMFYYSAGVNVTKFEVKMIYQKLECLLYNVGRDKLTLAIYFFDNLRFTSNRAISVKRLGAHFVIVVQKLAIL